MKTLGRKLLRFAILGARAASILACGYALARIAQTKRKVSVNFNFTPDPAAPRGEIWCAHCGAPGSSVDMRCPNWCCGGTEILVAEDPKIESGCRGYGCEFQPEPFPSMLHLRLASVEGWLTRTSDTAIKATSILHRLIPTLYKECQDEEVEMLVKAAQELPHVVGGKAGTIYA